MTSRGIRLAIALTAAAGLHPANAQQTNPVATDSDRVGAICSVCLSGAALGLRALPDTGRPRAIEYSDAYAVRLKIHLIGSYLELPLFAAEYLLGNRLLKDTTTYSAPGTRRSTPSSTRTWHNTVAGGLGILFATNTVTGLWNLIESRHEPAGRLRRWLHSLAMLAADAGFVLTANAGGPARRTSTDAAYHRNLAIGSMGLATISTLTMWLWKD